MDNYTAYRKLTSTVLPSVKGTQWSEPIRIATDALLEKIQAEEATCESCMVNPVMDEVRKVVSE